MKEIKEFYNLLTSLTACYIINKRIIMKFLKSPMLVFLTSSEIPWILSLLWMFKSKVYIRNFIKYLIRLSWRTQFLILNLQMHLKFWKHLMKEWRCKGLPLIWWDISFKTCLTLHKSKLVNSVKTSRNSILEMQLNQLWMYRYWKLGAMVFNYLLHLKIFHSKSKVVLYRNQKNQKRNLVRYFSLMAKEWCRFFLVYNLTQSNLLRRAKLKLKSKSFKTKTLFRIFYKSKLLTQESVYHWRSKISCSNSSVILMVPKIWIPMVSGLDLSYLIWLWTSLTAPLVVNRSQEKGQRFDLHSSFQVNSINPMLSIKRTLGNSTHHF